MLNKELIPLCLVATAVIFMALLPSLEATPKAINIFNDRHQVMQSKQNKSSIDARCANCPDDCPPHCGPTEPHHCDDDDDCEEESCPPADKPAKIMYPNVPSITFSTNCDFCDHNLYTLTCVETPFGCAARCAVDLRCSHFTYIANQHGGTCILKKAFGSGGAWATGIPSPSPYVCGYIPSRALIGIFLNICVGLDITGTIRTGTA